MCLGVKWFCGIRLRGVFVWTFCVRVESCNAAVEVFRSLRYGIFNANEYLTSLSE